MENKNNNKNKKEEKNKSIRDTYNEILDFVLQDKPEIKENPKIVNLNEYKNKKNSMGKS